MTDIHAEPLLEHIPRQTQVQSDYAADYDSLPAHPQARSSSQTNVGQMERMASVIAGGLVFAYGVRQRGTFGLSLIAAGGGLIYRGVTGHCPAYEAAGISTAGTDNTDGHIVLKKETKVEKAVTIDKAPQELYRFWRNFENLPRFMKHLESVTTLDDRRSHWVAKAPMGQKVEWDAEIINEIDGSLIAWRTTGEADVAHTGSVHFDAAPGGRGTEVRVVMQYAPPGGKIGETIAKLFGEEPSLQIADDLSRLKQLMEAGEIPTTEGQPRAAKHNGKG